MDLTGRTLGSYRILSQLGKGGMGTVYRACEANGRAVAIKVLDRGNARVSERFRREAELLARVGSHPHIVAIHAAGEHEGIPYIVMELVDGGSIETKLPFAPPEAARVVEEIARAVHHLHGLGIVHRDLKPGNVLQGADGRARLTDFGLARDVNRATRLTGLGQVVGTPFYMAPEQLKGSNEADEDPGPLSDVYALGALLFATLVGRPPYEARTLAELVGLVTTAPPPVPSGATPGLTTDLDDVVTKACAKEPGDRYASALALAEDLARFRRGEAVTARPVSSFVHVVRLASREPGRAALLALACVLTLSAAPLARLGWSFVETRIAASRALGLRHDFAAAAEQARTIAESELKLASGELKVATNELAPAGKTDRIGAAFARAASHTQAALAELDRLPPPPPGTAAEPLALLSACRVRILVALGDVERAQGEDARALGRYREAAALEPPTVELVCRLAEAEGSTGDLAAASATIAPLLRDRVDRPSVKRAQGLVLVARGEAREAARILVELARGGNDPIALLWLARAQLGSGDQKAALATLDALERIRLPGAVEHRIRGRALAAEGDERAADRELVRAASLAPDDAGLALELSRYLASRGEADRARRIVEPVLARAPIDGLVAIARARLLGGEIAPAIAALESAAGSTLPSLEGAGPSRALALDALVRRATGNVPTGLARAKAAVARATTDDSRNRASFELGRCALAAFEAEAAIIQRTTLPTPFASGEASTSGADMLNRAEVAFETAGHEPLLRVEAIAGLARVALARGQLPRARELLAPLRAAAHPDVLAAWAELALASKDPAALEVVRERARSVRLGEEQTGGAEAGTAGGTRWPQGDERMELALALESSGLGLLSFAERKPQPERVRTATAVLEIAVATLPSPRAQAALARAKLLSEEPDEALALAWRASLVDPGAGGAAIVFMEAALTVDRALAPALADLETFLSHETLGPEEILTARALEARALVRLGKPDLAREQLRLTLKVRPRSQGVLAALAAIDRILGDEVEAERSLLLLIANRKELEALAGPYQKVTTHGLDLTAEDRSVIEKRIELDPTFGPAYQQHAGYRLQDWNVAGALLDYARNLIYDGGAASEFLDWTSNMNKDRVLEPEQIRSQIRDAAEPVDRSARAYAAGLAELLAIESGVAAPRLDAAVRAFDRVLALDPRARCTLVYRGRTLQRLGRREAARADLDAALDLEDALPLAHYFRALVAAEEGDGALALEHLQQSVARGWNIAARAANDPDLEPIHQDPAFKAWVAKTR